MITLNTHAEVAYSEAKSRGFHDEKRSFAESLMLIVSELAEALEADRHGRWCKADLTKIGNVMHFVTKEEYEKHIKGTVEEEIADAMIRIFDLAGEYKINLDWHVVAKMEYNKTRGYKHGKKY